MTVSVIAFVVPFVLGVFTVGLNLGIWAYRPAERRHLALATAAAAGVLLIGATTLVYTADSRTEAVWARIGLLLAAGPAQAGNVWLAQRVYGGAMHRHHWLSAGVSLAIAVLCLVPGLWWTGGTVVRGTGFLGLAYVDVELTLAGHLAPLALLPGTAWLVARSYWRARAGGERKLVLGAILASGAAVAGDLLVAGAWIDAPYVFGYACTVATIVYTALMLRRFVVTLQRVEESAELLQRAAESRARELREADLRLAHGARLAALGTLAAGLAHEINNPVAFIRSNLSYLEDLAKNGDEDPELDEVLAETEEGVARLRGIVDELMRMSSQGSARFDTVSLHEVVESALPTLRFEARDDVALDARLAPTPPVRGDRNLLGQVVANLVINAIQAARGTDERGVVRIATFADDRRAVLEVADSGPGVPPELAQRIFEPFFTTKPAGEGTGLGLAVSAQLVERHGGRLSLLPSPRGARFQVELPLARVSDERDLGAAHDPRGGPRPA
jgi:signal transduction histidine kinase